MSNREGLNTILIEKMGESRSKIAMEVMDSFDRYIVDQGISEVELYEIEDAISVQGLISRVKANKQIRLDFKGKVFFLERGLFHLKNLLIDVKEKRDANDAWREISFETNDNVRIIDDNITYSDNDSYEKEKISRMLADPEAFIRELEKRLME